MKEIFVLTDVERLEERLERRLSRITKLEPITLENGFAGGGIVYALEVTETKNKKSNGEGVIVKNKNSKIFVTGNRKTIVYITRTDNIDVLSELDYIHSIYFWLMGVTQNVYMCEEHIVIIINKIEDIEENEENYGNSQISIYNGQLDNQEYTEFLVSNDVTKESIAKAFEKYLSLNKIYFKNVTGTKFDLWEILVFEVELSKREKNDIKIRELGNNGIAGKIMQVGNNSIRVLIGNKEDEYLMRTYGEEILDCKREVITVTLLNDIMIKIYQKHAKKLNA